MVRRLRPMLSIPLLWLALPVWAYDWLQFNGDPQHSGNNTHERAVDKLNVGQLIRNYQVTLPAAADGTPVFLESVVTAGGTKNLLFVTTMAGHILALDAHTGVQIWSQQHGAGTCQANNAGSPCYTNSSPAIDPNRLYVYSYGLDGFVHKYQVGDGLEITGSGWPQLVTTKGFDEKSAGALATATVGGARYLYAVTGGYPGDNGDYQGHVTAINLSSGTQAVFNTMCSDLARHLAHNDAGCSAVRSAIWARPGVIYHANTNRIFVGTGNGSYNGNIGGHNWSESILALNPDGTGVAGKPIDSYTPSSFSALDSADADLGSTAPAVLPVPANSNVQSLAVQGGKDALLRLVNLANLSGAGGPGHVAGEVSVAISVPQGGQVVSQPAVWTNPVDQSTWVFVSNSNGISGLRLAVDGAGNPSLVVQWQKSGGGFSPVVANSVIYYAGSNILRALDPTTGNSLWTSALIGGIHWQSPMMANSAVYVLDQSNHLTAFGLPLTAGSGTPQGARVGTAYSAPLVAMLVDSANNPVPNATVSWTLPGVGANATLSGTTSTTNAQGLASVTATASAISGAYTVMAQSGTLSAAFELNNSLATAIGTGCNIPNSAVNDLIEQYYQAILARPSEAKTYWVNEVARMCGLGTDPEQIFVMMGSLFFGGIEYAGLPRTDPAFVTDLYIALLGRLPGGNEISYWTALLQQGLPRSSVMASFLFSQEFGGVLERIFASPASRAEIETVVNMYGGLLGRFPENSGFNYWVAQLRQAQCLSATAVQASLDSITRQFVSGPEYASRNRTNAEYVQDLYFGLLQRGAEPAGFNYWLGKLNTLAMTRDQVRQGFFASPETQAIIANIAGQGCLP